MINSKKVVGINFEMEGYEQKDFNFYLGNKDAKLILGYDDVGKKFNFNVNNILLDNFHDGNIVFNEKTNHIKKDIFIKYFDFETIINSNPFNNNLDDIFKRDIIMDYNYKKSLQFNSFNNFINIFNSTSQKNHKINSNLYENYNNKIESSLELCGNILYWADYVIRLDSNDSFNLSFNMDKFGIGLSKYNNINQLAMWTDYKINDLKFKLNTIIKDKDNKIYYDTSVIFKYNDNINIGGLVSLTDFNINEFSIGCDLINILEFENIQLNYMNLKDNPDEVEAYLNFNVNNLNIQNYSTYFDNLLHNISQIERTL